MADVQAAHRRHLPGDIAVWFFIFAELAVFGILFIGFRTGFFQRCLPQSLNDQSNKLQTSR